MATRDYVLPNMIPLTNCCKNKPDPSQVLKE
jgi:hypothetical protein